MMPFIRHLKFSVGLLCGLALCADAAQAPQHINIKQLSTTVEDVVVPLPNEIFGALNKLGTVNWRAHVRSDKGPNFTERPRIALLLGTVIAEGFVAVEAEDADQVEKIGRSVLSLSGKLGVRKRLSRRPAESEIRPDTFIAESQPDRQLGWRRLRLFRLLRPW